MSREVSHYNIVYITYLKPKTKMNNYSPFIHVQVIPELYELWEEDIEPPDWDPNLPLFSDAP